MDRLVVWFALVLATVRPIRMGGCEGASMGHPNEDLIRRGYDAFSRGDMDTLLELYHPDIVWHASGRNQLAGDHRGVDAVFGFFGQTMELTGGNFRVEVHDVVANDQHGVGLHKAYTRAGRSGAGGQRHAGIPRPRRQGHRGVAVLGGPVRR